MRRFLGFGSVILVLLLCGTVFANGIIVVPPRPRPPRVAEPLKQPSVKEARLDVSIDGQTAKVTVDEVFFNPNNWQVEGTFIFPLPADASIDDMSFWMNGKEQKGELLDAQQARQEYLKIVRRIKDPALLEYMGTKMFKLRIFPMPPRGTMRVKFSYTQFLKSEGDLVLFRYPTSTNKYSSAPIGSFIIDIHLKADKPLKNIYCPTYKVDVVRKGEKEARVTFEAQNIKPDRDFLLYYSTSGADVGFSLLSFCDGTEDGYFMALITPKYVINKKDIQPKDVVFVVDTSGSMLNENKMAQAKEALSYCVKNLNEKDRFNIITFATGVRMFRDALVVASKEAKATALEWIGRLSPSGGTNINDALLKAFGTVTQTKRPVMIIFMTDGEPTIGIQDPKKILENVKNANKVNARIFVFGVGETVNTKLLDRLAEENRGTADYITKDEKIDVKVKAFFDKVSSPVLSDVVVKFNNIEVYDIYPTKIADLFRGEQLVLVGRYHGSGAKSVSLTGKVNGEARTLIYEGRFVERGKEKEFIPRIWATRKIGYLLSEIRLHGEKQELKNEVVRLATRFGILTPYTSYLVIEDIRRPRRPGLRPLTSAPLRRRLREEMDRDAGFAREAADAEKEARGRMKAEGGAGAVNAAKELKKMKQAAAAPAKPGVYTGEALFGGKGQTGRELAKAIRTVADKTFYFVDDTWYDSIYDPEKHKEVKKVKYMSDEYLELLMKKPEIGKFFALGKSVVVIVDGKAYQVIEEEEEKK